MWEQVRANRRHAAILVAAMALLLFGLGWLLGTYYLGSGRFGVGIAAVVWLVQLLVAWFAGDSIFLAISRARKIGKGDHPTLWNVVEEMTIAAGLPRMPDIYIIDDDAPNAFATGRGPDSASVAVTAGLLNRLDRDELQGVVAHELSHVGNRDVLYMLMVGVMMGSIVLLADLGARTLFHGGRRRTSSGREGGGAAVLILAVVVMIVAPLLAQLLYFAVSRRREYLADASSTLLTRYPEGLASALEKIALVPARLASATRATAPLFIVNPLAVTAQGMADLTSTHPSISERVRILRGMTGTGGLKEYDRAFRKVTGRPVGIVPARALARGPAAPRPGGVGRPAPPLPIPVPVPAAAALIPTAAVGRVRETTDALWRLNDYAFIACDCDTRLKIPPAYRGKVIECPHCRKPHRVP
jgi:heat shock protein HtpX